MKNWWMVPMAFLAIAFAVTATKAETGKQKKDEQIKVVLKSDQDGSMSTLELDNLQELAVGESRDYYSDNGKQAKVTREEKGYRVEFDGKVTHIESGADSLTLHDGGQFVTIDGEGGKSCIITKVRTHGKDGKEFVYAYRAGGDETLDVEAVIRNIEKSEHFSEMDPAEQEKVRAAIRELKDKISDEGASRKTVIIEVENEK